MIEKVEISSINLIYLERQKHKYSITEDVTTNKYNQLSAAASFLARYHIPYSNRMLEDAKPIGWDKQKWLEMCKKSYKERLVLSRDLLTEEINRIENV